MGIGLVIAVIGFGSTFAADIQINNDETSEFGQGDTQTVYCGDNPGGEPNIITVTPISAFVNSVDTPTWRPPVFVNKQWREVGSASFASFGVRTFTGSYVNDATGVTETQIGYWVKDRISTDYYSRSSVDALFNRGTPPTGDYDTFVPQEQKDGKYGFNYYQTWTAGFTAETTEDRFELGGVNISDIPSGCDGRDFVISAYGSGAEPLELSDVLNVTEVAVNYDSRDATPAFSFDRTTPNANSDADGKVTVSADTGSIKVLFTTAAGRPLTDSVIKVVVETQETTYVD
jgi:hypothetical protein